MPRPVTSLRAMVSENKRKHKDPEIQRLIDEMVDLKRDMRALQALVDRLLEVRK